jgi:Holliday junction resolvase
MERDKVKGNPSYRRSRKQEKELARRGNGKLVPGSGSGAEKGDIKGYNGIVRIEAKTTKNKSFSITRDMVKKIEEAALGSGELPAIVVEFNDGRGNPELEVAVVPTYVLDNLKP